MLNLTTNQIPARYATLMNRANTGAMNGHKGGAMARMARADGFRKALVDETTLGTPGLLAGLRMNGIRAYCVTDNGMVPAN